MRSALAANIGEAPAEHQQPSWLGPRRRSSIASRWVRTAGPPERECMGGVVLAPRCGVRGQGAVQAHEEGVREVGRRWQRIYILTRERSDEAVVVTPLGIRKTARARRRRSRSGGPGEGRCAPTGAASAEAAGGGGARAPGEHLQVGRREVRGHEEVRRMQGSTTKRSHAWRGRGLRCQHHRVVLQWHLLRGMRRVPSSLWPSSSAPSSENVDESMGAVEKGSEVDVMEYSRCQGSPSGREAGTSARTSIRPSKSRLCRAKIRDDVKQKRPICVVGCPPCTMFSVVAVREPEQGRP